MASFLRRFTTSASASASKKMYFILAAASAFPLYTIFNDSNTSPSSTSRSNVFVSAKNPKERVILPPNAFSLTLPSTPNLPVVLFFNFSTTRFQKRHAISVNLLPVSMDLGIQGVLSIESSQGCVFDFLCKYGKQVGSIILTFCEHKIQFMAQGGDFTNRNGTGGKSIYGPKFSGLDFVIFLCRSNIHN